MQLYLCGTVSTACAFRCPCTPATARMFLRLPWPLLTVALALVALVRLLRLSLPLVWALVLLTMMLVAHVSHAIHLIILILLMLSMPPMRFVPMVGSALLPTLAGLSKTCRRVIFCSAVPLGFPASPAPCTLLVAHTLPPMLTAPCHPASMCRKRQSMSAWFPSPMYRKHH